MSISSHIKLPGNRTEVLGVGSRGLDVLNAFKVFCCCFFFFYPHTVVFTKWGEGQRRAAALGPPTGRLESREEPGAPAKGRSV